MSKSPPKAPARNLAERSATVRQSLLEALRGGPLTAHELSSRVGISERDVADHLEHLDRSLRHTPDELQTEPPVCRGCGFVFRKRERLTRPGACPKCRGTHIDPPTFFIAPRS